LGLVEHKNGAGKPAPFFFPLEVGANRSMSQEQNTGGELTEMGIGQMASGAVDLGELLHKKSLR
jgi:hypothetical protein